MTFAQVIWVVGLIAAFVAITCGLLASMPSWGWFLTGFGLAGNSCGLVLSVGSRR